MTWLASWLKTGNRYTLEQMRSPLPASLRQRLEYRDAISIAFLAAYMLPEMRGLLIGFGSGNIFRRLNRERRWVPYAAAYATRWRLARTACGHPVWRIISPTDARGRRPRPCVRPGGGARGRTAAPVYVQLLRRVFLRVGTPGTGVRAALRSLRIEGNLNRFAAVSAWIERSARNGGVTEDTVTRAQAAQIDLALLDDPALMALPWEGNPAISEIDFPHDDGVAAIRHVWRYAGETADRMLQDNPNPAGGRSVPTQGRQNGGTVRRCPGCCAS